MPNKRQRVKQDELNGISFLSRAANKLVSLEQALLAFKPPPRGGRLAVADLARRVRAMQHTFARVLDAISRLKPLLAFESEFAECFQDASAPEVAREYFFMRGILSAILRRDGITEIMPEVYLWYDRYGKVPFDDYIPPAARAAEKPEQEDDDNEID